MAYIDITSGIAAFLDNYMRAKTIRQQQTQQQQIRQITFVGPTKRVNFELEALHKLSCQFCAAPLESNRCEYCGRRN